MKVLEHDFWYRAFHIKVYTDDDRLSNQWCWYELLTTDILLRMPTHRHYDSINKCLADVQYAIDETIKREVPEGVLLITHSREVKE